MKLDAAGEPDPETNNTVVEPKENEDDIFVIYAKPKPSKYSVIPSASVSLVLHRLNCPSIVPSVWHKLFPVNDFFSRIMMPISTKLGRKYFLGMGFRFVQTKS